MYMRLAINEEKAAQREFGDEWARCASHSPRWIPQNYLPNVEPIVKIPPSMMLQPWMGSDFTNDDLVKESSILDDYTHKVLGVSALDGQPSYQVEATPKPDAAVVWGRVVYWVPALRAGTQRFRVECAAPADGDGPPIRRTPSRWPRTGWRSPRSAPWC